MKKFVSMLVVLAMVLSMVPAVFAAEAAMSGTIETTSGVPCKTDTWTAESDGVLTISVSSEEGVGYKVYINGEAQSLMWAMTYAETVSYEVATGDTVYLEVQGYNPDSWTYCDATINWAYSFDAEGVVKEPYAIVMEANENGDEHWTISTEGDHEVAMIETAEVTVVTVSPEEAGVYTITVQGDAEIGNCGTTVALIDTNVDFGTSVEWTCAQAGYWTETEIPDEDWDTTGDMITIEQYISGQSLMLGIKSDSETVTVNVEKTGEYTAAEEIELQTYVNKAELTAFAVPADATLGDYVDVYGDTHTAVLGNDGYYHLDSADGDILLVDMDYLFRLSTALEGGRGVMYAYIADENGTIAEKWDIGAAVRAYEAVCDENGYYPLTEDLMFFYQDYAEGNGVYSYALGTGYNADCAWMYACLTMALPEAEDYVLTIEEAIAMGSAMEHNTYTEDKYYVTGVITEVYNETYGNMKITDDAGNILTVYGTYSADGSTRYDAMEVKPVAGDTVTIYGVVGQYNDKAQIKNGWIVEHVVAENEDPAADTVLTIEEAIALGESKDHNNYTAGKYYVTGVITEVYNETYGNMKIADEAGNILTVYGTYSADGSTRYDAMEVKPVAGDTVTVYGIIGQYSGNAQIKNGWITEHIPAEDDTLAGSGTEEDPYIIESLPYTIEISYANDEQADAGVFFAYTPEANGTITIADFENETNMGILTEVDSWVHVTDTNELEVTAGTQVLLYHWAMWAGDYDLTLEFTESTGDEGGDEEEPTDPSEPTDPTDPTPDSGEWSGTDVAVAADEVITIVYTPETNGTLSVAVSCETGWQVNVNSEFTSESYWSDGSDTPDAIKLTAGTTYTIEIVPYDQADGWTTCDAVMTYELTWTAESTGSDVEGSGTDEDPYVLIVDGDNYASIADGEGETVWFIWTAEADGTLNLSFDESDPQPWITPYIGGIGGGNGQSGWTHSFKVTAGTTVMLCVETYDFVAAEYCFYASFEAGSTGSEVEAVELYDGENYLSIWAGEGTTPYTYTATQTGTLYLTFTEFAYENSWGYSDCSDYMEGYFGLDDWGNENWMMLTINGVMADTYYGSVEVTEGDVVAIGWEYYGANDYVQSNNNMFATLDLNYEGFVIPEPGSIDAPYEMSKDDVDFGFGTTAEVAAGTTVYYNMGGFDGSTVTFTGEGNFTVNVCSYELDENWNEVEVWTSYEAVDGVAECVISGYYVLISIENNSDAAAVYEVGYYYPVGHVMNPDVITGEGTWTASVGPNSNGYYYSWNMGDDSLTGIMTITVGGESWQYYVTNETQYASGDVHYMHDDPQVTSEEWTVFAGDVFTFWVNTNYNDVANWDYDTPAGEITITVTFEEQELVQGVDYPYAVYSYEVPCEISVAAGAEVWVDAYSFAEYYLTVAGEGAYVVYNDVIYTDDDGDGIIKIAISDYVATLTLGNTGDADAVYSISYEVPVGHEENPQIITEDGVYATHEFADGGYSNYYFQYTATENGTITVEVQNDTNWRITLWNPDTYASVGGNSNGDTNVFTMKVAAGDVIKIYGATFDPSIYQVVAGVLSFNFSFEKEELSTDDAIVLVDGDNAIGMDNLDSTQTPAVFTYTATQSGTLYLTMSEVLYSSYSSWDDSMSEPSEGRNYLLSYTVFQVNGEPLANGYYGAIEVEAGDEITITWNMKYNYMWQFTANLNLSYEGYNPAPGSAADPIEVSFYDCYEVPVETVEIAAGSTAHYILQGFYGYTLTITGEGAYMIYNGVNYTAENGVIELTGDDYEMIVEIGNSGDTAAVFTIGGAFPVGEMMNPEVIVDGEYTATMEENDDNYFFAYNVNCEGILDITVSGDSWTFMIYNETTGMSYFDGEWSYWGGWYNSSAYDGQTTVSIDVYPGDKIQIAVNTEFAADDPEGLWGTSPAGTVTLTVASEYFHEDEDGDNCCDICGEEMASVLLGDVNGDGNVDIFDANLIVGYFNGTAELTDEQLVAADVTGDGSVDIFDANMIVGYFNGTVVTFPAEEK